VDTSRSAAVSPAEAIAQDLARERRERLPVDRSDQTANGSPPELSKQEEPMDGVGGFFKEPDSDAFVSESDRALAEMIAQAEHERELGRVAHELGLDNQGSDDGSV
jgi:hypothetical protein